MSSSPISLTKRPARRPDGATRQLCAGAYLDREFRDTVVNRVLLDPDHRVAPSYGFDVVPVVDHAKRAMILDFAQQACFVGVLVGAGLASVAVPVTVICALCFWRLAIRALRVAPDVSRLKAKEATDRLLRRTRFVRENRDIRQAERELKLTLSGCGLLIVTPRMVAAMRGEPIQGVLWSTLWVIVSLAMVVVIAGGAQRHAANRMFHADSLRPKRLSRRQHVIDEQQSSAFVVYRRPKPKPKLKPWEEEPLNWPQEPEDEPALFVGSGELVHRWLPPLAIQLLRPERSIPGADGKPLPMSEREHVLAPFETDELVEALRSAMEELGDWTDPGSLPGFRVAHRIYVEEAELSVDRTRLSRPLDPEERNKIINDPHNPSHHYLEIRTSATGELVTTAFIRVTVKGRTLSFDFATSALTRLPKDYECLAYYREHGLGAVARAALAALWNLPGEVGRSWRLLSTPRLLVLWLRARTDRTLVPRRRSAIGTVYSVREERAVKWIEADLDQSAILDQMKIIELRLLKAAEDFLDAHDVDTSDFKKRAQFIISANVLNMAGRVEIKDSAIGNQAQVLQDVLENQPEGDKS